MECLCVSQKKSQRLRCKYPENIIFNTGNYEKQTTVKLQYKYEFYSVDKIKIKKYN